MIESALTNATIIGLALIAAGAAMTFVADKAKRDGASWLERRVPVEFGYAVAAGALITFGFFMALPVPR